MKCHLLVERARKKRRMKRNITVRLIKSFLDSRAFVCFVLNGTFFATGEKFMILFIRAGMVLAWKLLFNSFRNCFYSNLKFNEFWGELNTLN